MAELPPWLTRDYDPVGTFMRAYQTGAQIRQEQTRLAEQQRQANMEAQARQQQLEQQALLAAVNNAVDQSYKQQVMDMRQKELEAEKQRADIAARLAQERFQEQVQHNLALEQASMMRAEAAARGKDYGEITTEDLPGGATAVYRQGSPGLHIVKGQDGRQTALQDFVAKSEFTQAQKAIENAKKDQTNPNIPPSERPTEQQIKDLEKIYADRAMMLTNLPPPRVVGPSATNAIPSLPFSAPIPIIGEGQGGRIPVISPDGRKGSVPASQIKEALAAGYKFDRSVK